MRKLYDERGKEIKEGQIIRVFHFTGVRKKKHYMYKQVAILNDSLYGLHLPITPRHEASGYYLNTYADSSNVLQGTKIVQCHCDNCINGIGCL